MTLYIIVLILLYLAAFQLKNERLGYVAIAIMLAMSMFRADSVGADTYNYLHVDSTYKSSGLKENEFVFYFLVSLKTIFGKRFVIFSFSLITFLFLLLSCKRFKVSTSTAFFFYVLFIYFNLSLNIARQFAGISVLLYAYSFLLEQDNKKKYIFFPLVLLAGGIHTSCYFCLPLFFVNKINFHKIPVVVQITLIFVLYILIHTVLNEFFVVWATTVSLYEDVSVYSHYFEQSEVRSGSSISNTILNVGSLAVGIWILYNMRKKENNEAFFLTSLYFISLIIDLFFENLYGNVGRVRFCINIVNIVVFAYYFANISDKYKRITLFAAILFFGSKLYYSWANGSYDTTPFEFM